MVRLLSVCFATTCLLGWGCALPNGEGSTVEDAYYRWLGAALACDTDALWGMLKPETQDKFNAWVRHEKDTKALLPKVYAKKVADEAATHLPAAKWDNGQALFTHLVGKETTALGLFATIGARVKSTDTSQSGRWTLKTMGGDTITLSQGKGDQFYVELPSNQATRLKSSVREARLHLEGLKKKLKLVSVWKWPKS
jgi:hypothetical protein